MSPQRTPAGKQDAIMMEAEKEIAGEEGEKAESVDAAASEAAVLTEKAAETAVVTEPTAVTTPAAETPAVLNEPAAEMVNAAELGSQMLDHHFENSINDLVAEGLEEMILKKADRLMKKIAQTAELPKPTLKRTKKMTNKRKSSQAEIEEKMVKRAKKREERQQKKEEEKRYDEQRRIVPNPNPQQPIEATPIDAQPPEIVHWDTFLDEDSNLDVIRVKRADGRFDLQRNWDTLLRRYTRTDLEEMYKVGKELYGDLLREDVAFSYRKMVIEYLCCMFETRTVDYLIRRPFGRVVNWILYENCGVYSILLDTGLMEFYLVDRIYKHIFKRLSGMVAVKLKCRTGSEMGAYLIKRTLNQQLGLDPDLGLH